MSPNSPSFFLEPFNRMVVSPLSFDGPEDVFDDLLTKCIDGWVFSDPPVVALYRFGMYGTPRSPGPFGLRVHRYRRHNYYKPWSCSVLPRLPTFRTFVVPLTGGFLGYVPVDTHTDLSSGYNEKTLAVKPGVGTGLLGNFWWYAT